MLTFKLFLFLALEIAVIVFVAAVVIGGTWMLVAPRLRRATAALRRGDVEAFMD